MDEGIPRDEYTPVNECTPMSKSKLTSGLEFSWA